MNAPILPVVANVPVAPPSPVAPPVPLAPPTVTTPPIAKPRKSPAAKKGKSNGSVTPAL